MVSVGGGSTKYLGLVLVVRLRVWWFYFLRYFFSLFLLFSFSPSHYLLSFVFPLPNLLSFPVSLALVFFSLVSLYRVSVFVILFVVALCLWVIFHITFSPN